MHKSWYAKNLSIFCLQLNNKFGRYRDCLIFIWTILAVGFLKNSLVTRSNTNSLITASRQTLFFHVFDLVSCIFLSWRLQTLPYVTCYYMMACFKHRILFYYVFLDFYYSRVLHVMFKYRRGIWEISLSMTLFLEC
jgi:hypothetical protein